MYVPRHWHWVAPFGAIIATFGINQQFLGGTFHWDYMLLVQLPVALIAREYATYLNKAGVAYQNYITGTPKPEPEKELPELIDWNTGRTLQRQPIEIINHAQTVEMPKFNVERRFAIDVLRMYDMEPDTQMFVDLTEERWVIQKKQFAQKPFANLKKKWEAFGVLKRKNKNKNAKYLVSRREAVALIASGNPLPEWSPSPPN